MASETENESSAGSAPGSGQRLTPENHFRKLGMGEIFPGDERPFEVDLGCGDGGFVMAMAKHYPGRNFLAVERLLGRVRKVCRKSARAGLGNLKVLRLESAYTVGWLLPDAGVSRLHLLCPDPWPKKRHQRRRLINDPDFRAGLLRVLADGGEFLFKTDHASYFEEAEEVVGQMPGLERVAWEDDAFFYPETDFEKQWLEEGRTVQRARWVKRG